MKSMKANGKQKKESSKLKKKLIKVLLKIKRKKKIYPNQIKIKRKNKVKVNSKLANKLMKIFNKLLQNNNKKLRDKKVK